MIVYHSVIMCQLPRWSTFFFINYYADIDTATMKQFLRVHYIITHSGLRDSYV